MRLWGSAFDSATVHGLLCEETHRGTLFGGCRGSADAPLPNDITQRAGFLTAAVFRSVRGPKSAAVAGVVGAAAAAGLHAARQKWPSL